MLQHYYSTHPCDSRLDNLTLSMLSTDKKGVKLRAKGAECRNLVPFSLQLALDHLDASVPFEAAAKEATIHLAAMYQNLAKDFFNAEDLKKKTQQDVCTAIRGSGGQHGRTRSQ